MSFIRKLYHWIKHRVTSYTLSKPVKTFVSSRPLTTRTIRVDKDSWEAFVKFCRERGTSTCFEIRSYIDARLGGEAIVTSKQPLTIHQTVLYETARPRRKPSLPEYEDQVTLEYFGDPQTCAHCSSSPHVLGHVWVSSQQCNGLYLCRVHHTHYLKSRQRYSFRVL